MAFEKSQETAMTRQLHNALGRTVTYTAQDAAAVETKIVVNSGSELFPGGFEGDLPDASVTARLRKSVVTTARRGDTVTDADGVIYEVDNVDPLNDAEWLVTLRERVHG